jgi:5-methylcytosine rRNA methyltransferase NSUN4
MKKWGLGRSKRLASRQFAMLSSALLVLKGGGLMAYSTCALSPFENDGVIEKLMKKKGDQVQIIKKDFPYGERTEYGTIFLPDKGPFGPFYLALIKKEMPD